VSARRAADLPLRLAFVGQGVYFRQCALELPAAGVEPSFVDFRAGAPPAPMLARLIELDPDVVLVFRPEIVPPRLFAELRAVTIGFLTEPLPRTGGSDHPDLRTRLGWLQQVDATNFDRIVSFDPLIAQTAERVLPVWRSLPLPVADSLFGDVRPRASPPALLFVGRSSKHREAYLSVLQGKHDYVHVGHGLYGEQLQAFLRRADVELNLHNNPYPTFENRVCIALAAGHLVISEPLSPPHDLRPSEHFLEIGTPRELLDLLDLLSAQPGAFAEVQAAGRLAAERFRASLLYPQLIRDALADTASGGGRVR
jgi:hypothetical protein